MNFAEENVYETLKLSDKERYLIAPFFTNLEKSVFAVTFLPPEVVGALCSRTSRAKEDLRMVFLKEFVLPFIEEKSEYGKSLEALVDFLHQYPFEMIFSNPKGREFYIKWLAQFGDDSIAQMAGTHLVYSALSQLAIKHFEDMRVGIAPIEKSTRYVDYSSKIEGRYRYYIDSSLKEMGLLPDYITAMDGLFDAYTSLSSRFFEYLKEKYPEEKELVLKAKVFDTLRGLLPVATLSQVAFFGNGQTFEYLINRSLGNRIREIRWAGQEALDELNKIIPAFLRRVEGEQSAEYRQYLSSRSEKIAEAMHELSPKENFSLSSAPVRLLEYDPQGEDKIIAALLYGELQEPYDSILARVSSLSSDGKERILEKIMKGRKAKYYKPPRALENSYLRFEVTMNIGGWRDLHRHRMMTQFRERFHIRHGYDVPEDLKEGGFDTVFREAIQGAERAFEKIEKKDKDLAQYCVTLAHKVRFVQYQNLRSFFWEAELRTGSQGHPDYRKIEHEKIKLVKEIHPLITKYLMADMNDYSLARRGTVEQIQKKENELKDYFQKPGS